MQVTDEGAFNIQELTWEEAKESIRHVNSELFKTIELLNPGKKLTLVKAIYPFGAKIIEEAMLHLPHKSGRSIPIHSAAINDSLKKKLLYSPIPLSLPLNKATEIFVKTEEQVVPLKVISPGWFFGLFEVTSLLCGLNINPIWSVSSGARSLFMLPKIADKAGYNQFKKELNISLNPPRSLSDHYEIFTLISNHPSHINDWQSEILFFTDSWFTQPCSDPKWATFYNYLFRESNIQTHYNRDDIAFSLTWQKFVYAIGARGLRPRPYILDTVKHLVAIAAGLQPAFCPADTSEIVAPIKLLQNVYIDIYGLKNYLPTIFHPHILMVGQEIRPVYYSLSYPVLQEGLPYLKVGSDIISSEREIKLLFETLYTAIKTGRVNLPNIYNLLHKRQFEFFHNGPDIFNEIQPAKDMPLADPALLKDKTCYSEREFCATAPFLSGCIRISVER